MIEKEENKPSESNERENVRIGYQMAIEMWAHCGDEVWSRFNVMLVAHSIIILVGSSEHPPFKALSYILPATGFFICILWAIMMERAFAYQDYYLFTARNWEESALLELAPIKTISVGKDFGNIEKVLDFKEGCIRSCIRKWLHQNFNAKKASYWVIVAFLFLYIVLFIFGISK